MQSFLTNHEILWKDGKLFMNPLFKRILLGDQCRGLCCDSNWFILIKLFEIKPRHGQCWKVVRHWLQNSLQCITCSRYGTSQDLKLWQKNHCLLVTWVPRHGGRQYLRLLLTSRSLLLNKAWRLTLQRGMRGREGQGRREPSGRQGAIFFNICLCISVYI